MRTTIVLLLMGIGVGLAGTPALAATRTDGGETADATSLFTAERRAREAAERRRLPDREPPRWKEGGSGWAPAWRPDASPARPSADR